jgi:hypothetical protein
MTVLTWDATGEREYETGVDKGVLYTIGTDGQYSVGTAWSGLTEIDEKPGGAGTTPQYADNQIYVNLTAAETFAGTIKAFTFPDEFLECDGTVQPTPGVAVGQQTRKTFGLAYRTLIGNDTDGQDHGYKLHLAYGCQAAPSEKDYATVNDSPAAIAFSWDFTSTPVQVTGLKPTSLITIDSTQVDATALQSLEALLYGGADAEASLPLPDAVLALFPATPPA